MKVFARLSNHRKPLRNIAIALFLLGLATPFVKLLCTNVILPSMATRDLSIRIQQALDDAKSVDFFEFVSAKQSNIEDLEANNPLSVTAGDGVRILKKVTATPEQIDQFRRIISQFIIHQPNGRRQCFTPHHRIEILKADDSMVNIDVCFECDAIQITDHGRWVLPARWKQELSTLFSDAGMPVRTASDYVRIAREPEQTLIAECSDHGRITPLRHLAQ